MKNILKGKWVFDSSIILCFLDKDCTFHQEAKELFSLILSDKIYPVVAQQNIIEVGNVLRKAYHWTSPEIKKLLKGVTADFDFQIIHPIQRTYLTWMNLISDDDFKSFDYFDYFLSATMLDNGLKRILTANIKDFSKIPGIEAVNPFK